MRIKKTVFLILVSLTVSACGEVGAPTIPVQVQTASQTLTVNAEVADSASERQQGLMNRRSLGSDSGMLFVFAEEAPQSFWMRNTYVSLDMIFISESREIVHIAANTTPLSEEMISPAAPALYVLEVNAGWSADQGVSVGDAVEFTLP